jgi:type I restriction-modification system DNA methylase subunit
MADDRTEQTALVGIPQIAEIANVGRSAVGNWRKRHSDFPTAKVQTPSGALFDLREVEDWLIEHGKISERAPASARLWALADAARGLWTIDEFITFSVACLVYMEACARALDRGSSRRELPRPRIPRGAAWSDIRSRPPLDFLPALTEAVQAIEASSPELEGLLDPRLRDLDAPAATGLAHQIAMALDAATDEVSTRFALFEGLADLAARDRFAGEFSTPDEVAALVSRLVDFRGGIIIDPAVGEGDLLLRAAFLGRDSATDSTVLGIDINEHSWRRARSRFYLSGRQAEIRNENALIADPESLPLADAVVVDPPYGLGNWAFAELYVDPRWRFGPPPPNSADFAWLQLAALRLKPAGRAAVLMRTSSLIQGGREEAIRRGMVDAGVVESIVVLPPRLRTNTSIPLAIWLLRSPDARVDSGQVLLVDASELGAPGRSRFSLPQASVDRIVDLVSGWRETGTISTHDSAIATTASVGEILSAEASLNPSRYRSQPTIDLGAVQETARSLRHSLQESSAAATRAQSELLAYLEGRQ